MNSIAKAGFGACLAAAKLGYDFCRRGGRRQPAKFKSSPRTIGVKATFVLDAYSLHNFRNTFCFLPHTILPLFHKIHTQFDTFTHILFTHISRLDPAQIHDFSMKSTISPKKRLNYTIRSALSPISFPKPFKVAQHLQPIRDIRKQLAIFYSILSLFDDTAKNTK